jgi:hypothetical protein
MKRLLWGLLILSIAGCGWTASLEEMKASSPPRDDKLIVPGWRVGQLYLGMTSVALFAAMGEPDTTKPHNNFTWFRWENRGLSVLHDMEADQVEAIEVHHESYKTTEGVHIGMSELAVVAILGTPQASYSESRPHQTFAAGDAFMIGGYCYKSGIATFFENMLDNNPAPYLVRHIRVIPTKEWRTVSQCK